MYVELQNLYLFLPITFSKTADSVRISDCGCKFTNFFDTMQIDFFYICIEKNRYISLRGLKRRI